MYIYHLIPDPFHGSRLIPLNQMDISSDLYKNHASKYKGREGLMKTMIPKLNCKWNDVIHFSCIDPMIVAREIKRINPDLILRRSQYFKIHIDQLSRYRPVIFTNNPKNKDDSFSILENEIIEFTKNTYKELVAVPDHTIEYWIRAKKNNQPLLWFAFMPHIFINGSVETSKFEVAELSLD